jgi:transposase-like protein
MTVPSLYQLPFLFDEEKCIEFLLQHSIIYSSVQCQACGAETRREKKRWVCKKYACRKAISIFASSFFANTRLKCSEVMLLCYLWLIKASYQVILAATGHSSITVSEYSKYCRQMVAEILDDEDMHIGGPGVVVEVDESKLGKRKYHRGHRVEGIWILGGVERTEQRKVFVEPVPDRSASTILDVLSRHILPGSIIHTDMWRGYSGIEQELESLHFTVNHSEHFVDPENGTHTNTIEGTWNGMKLIIVPRNRTAKDMENRLFEFIWRRKHTNNLWDAMLDALKEVKY